MLLCVSLFPLGITQFITFCIFFGSVAGKEICFYRVTDEMENSLFNKYHFLCC